MAGEGSLFNIHGAGAQRSDPKSGGPAVYAEGRGTPGQDDQVRIYNCARCVRGGVEPVESPGTENVEAAPESVLPGSPLDQPDKT